MTAQRPVGGTPVGGRPVTGGAVEEAPVGEGPVREDPVGAVGWVAPPPFEVCGPPGSMVAGTVAAHIDAASSRAPFVVGVAGSVAVGKSRCASELRALLEARRVEVISTDGFLFPNATLAERGLSARKGFPESYDGELAVDVLGRIRAGAAEVQVPHYSHRTYDVEGPPQVVRRADIVVVEGVVALQPPFRDFCSLGVYLDADEADLRRWYVERFVELVDEGEGFYAQWAGVGAEDVRRLATMVWEHMNLPNLVEHILPTRWTADVVVRKAPDHSVAAVAVRKS